MRAALLLLLLAAAPADGFDGFWAEFRAAVAAGKPATIAGLTQTPFLFEGRQLDKSGFEAAAARLFDAPVRACFRQAKPVADGAVRMLFCRGSIFVFAPTKAGWRFTEIGVDD